MSERIRSKRIWAENRALKMFLTLVLACSFVFLIGGLSGVGKVKAEGSTFTFYNAADFTAYSQAYFAGTNYDGNPTSPDDTLQFSYLTDPLLTDDGFISIGTKLRPFSGTIVIPNTGKDTFELFNCALFDYVTTDLTIGGTGTVKIIRSEASETPAANVQTSGALFANHVMAGGHAANWSIALLPKSDNANASDPADSFGGLIGVIDDDCDVTVTFTNTSNLDVSASGNVGYICGTLGENATLTVTTAGSHSDISVTSSGGHAGGLVGEMGAEATLVLKSANNTHVNSVTAVGYAGGIVGVVNEVTSGNGVSLDLPSGEYTVSGTVTGTTGAGGLFGYYQHNDSDATTLDLNGTYTVSSGMTISSTGATGGIFGELVNGASGTSFTFDGNSEALNFILSGGTSRGGVCGTYTASALAQTLTITDTTVTVNATADNSGGLIGTVTDSPAYIAVSGATVTSSEGTLGGGLIGTVGSGGTFVDVSGAVTVSGSCQAGLIREMQQGVLRIQGITDISGFTATQAQLVNVRNHALVYALGSGSDYSAGSGWTFKRKTVSSFNNKDDIGSWGEVIRADGTILSEGDLFTVAGHTVTVKQANTTMDTLAKFALTALNIKLNVTEVVSGGALRFTSGSGNTSATLLASTLTLGADLNLSGTGLTGLTRDNGTNAAFSGTFDGDDHTLTFATGEKYGRSASGGDLSETGYQGSIYTHTYNGLFAKTSGATVQDVTLSGSFSIRQTVDNLRLGGVTAYATNGLTLSNVSADFTINTLNNNKTSFFGGAVGVGDSTGLNISITGGELHPTYNDKDGNADGTSYVGGAIGQVSYGATQTVSFTNCDLGLTFSKTGSKERLSAFGAAIASVANGTYTKQGRQITFTNVDIDITASGKTKNNNFGAILGTKWFASDVTINGVDIDASITASGSSNFGGLVHSATGYWNVQDISLGTVNFNVSEGTFGFIANKTYSDTNALYLEVDNTDSHYDISSLTFTGTPSFTVFDEIVADSRHNGTNITNNGNSIISIKTSGNVIDTTGSAYNTYLNKTAYGQTDVAAKKINPNTRYYYNIAYARGQASTVDKYNFLIWTVKQYAHSSLAAWFPSSSDFEGTLDMTGLSYYPINLTTGVTFTNATLKLDNVLMENNVKYAYSGEAGTRSTRSNTNQHYLMHTAAFRNVTAGITISGLTIQGNVPKLSDDFCGFLIAGTLGGLEESTTNFSATSVVFDGAHITTSAGADLTTTDYAPLFINKIGKKTAVTIDGASQSTTAYTGYTSKYAASSLIGNVGNSMARNIALTFSDLVFDGRSSATSIGTMDTTYGTTRSIFSRATILESFIYAGDSSGSYNYGIDEDWVDPSSEPADHNNVTYGKEITSSAENLNKQKKYLGSDYYTHPTTYESPSEYDFSTGFLPYVKVAFNSAENKHELSVNVQYNSDITGFGKYDDPYIIDSASKLEIISKIIYHAEDLTAAVKINIPDDVASFDYTSTGYGKSNYSFGLTNFTRNSGAGSSPLSSETVRQYIAGAYYVITTDIELSYTYRGLGLSTTNTENPEKYAFRGVIIGKNNGTELAPSYPTITIDSRSPLIDTSLGCVVKNVNIVINVDQVNLSKTITLSGPGGSLSYAYDGGIQTYGAVIGKIFGGDTIIDNVGVEFEDDVTISISGNNSSTFTRLVPVGGYVGTLVNGGLIFRNMAGKTGLTDDQTDDKITDPGYLYVNPIIGRVIAGYAFCEKPSGAYSASETVLNNGTKNYSIPVLSLAGGKLSVSSGYAITVPDGQAMYVLGAIVNSGAAAASGVSAAYQELSDFWSAYRTYTVARGGSDYSSVGNTDGTDTAYTDARDKDQYAKTTGTTSFIPYIVRAYTNAVSTNYYARALGNRNVTISVTGTCTVANGFRGIGSIYLDSAYVRLKVTSMDGGGNTITLNMRFVEYDHASVSKYRATATTAGFGLFNILQMNSANDSSNMIKNFTLSGSVYYDVLKISEGTSITYKYVSNEADGVGYGNVLNVGGVIGDAMGVIFYIQNVTIDGLELEGAKYVGGLVGYTGDTGDKDTRSIIDDCPSSATGITVKAGVSAGGLVGYMRSEITIQGVSSSVQTVFNVKEIKVKGLTTTGDSFEGSAHASVKYIYYDMAYSAGGLIGLCQPTRNNNSFVSEIKWYKIVGVSIASNKDHIYGDQSGVSQNTHAGGVIGVIKNRKMKFTNVSVEDVKIKATNAGGILGSAFSDNSFSNNTIKKVLRLTFNNVKLDGQVSAGSKSTIKGSRSAGGFVGKMETARGNANGGALFMVGDLNDHSEVSEIKDYIIESNSASSSTNQAAGGFLGYSAPGNTEYAYVELKIHNFLVDGCEISNLSTGAGAVTLRISNVDYQSVTNGTGGFIGVIFRTKIEGYNILINNTGVTSSTSSSGDDYRTSSLIGVNRYSKSVESPVDELSYVKLVGVSVNLNLEKNDVVVTKATTISRAVGNAYSASGETYGEYTVDEEAFDGYIVFADYNGVQTNTTYSNITGGAAYTNIPASATSPYATINPSITIGGKTITGDGVAADVEHLAIKSITSTGKYAYAASAYYDGSEAPTNYAVFNSFINDKLVMFSSVATGYEGTNFPVLLLESTDKDVSNKEINSYLRLLTNTTFDFGASDARFSVVIYNMVYSRDVFTPSASGASLKLKNGKFYMLSTDFDTGKASPQFSLIDVRFYDPSSSAVAYHLYVPVFVKKVLSFKFDMEILSGTTYLGSAYASAPGALIENVGSPVTAYFRYTYSRTVAEWESAINAGDKVHRNYAKSIVFQKQTGGQHFDNDTILVLVDPNDGGKVYYATWGDAYSAGKLNLSAFHPEMDGSGDAFTPKNFDDFMTVTAISEGDDRNLVRCAADHADLIVVDSNGQGYRMATDAEAADAGVTKYRINVTPKYMVEDKNGAYVSGASSGDDGAIQVGGEWYRPATPEDDDDKYSALTESYYLSIFTEDDEVFHYYTVTSENKFSEAGFPSERISTAGQSKDLIMGRIFEQSNFSIRSASVRGDQLMIYTEQPRNNQLTVTMTAEIGLSDFLSEVPVGNDEHENVVKAMKGFLRQNTVKVYQDFLVYLTRNNCGDITKAILGNPTGAGSYYLNDDDENRVTYGGGLSESEINVTVNFAEFISEDLSGVLAEGDNNTRTSFTITAEVSLTYGSEDAIESQFPGRSESFPDNGVTVSGASNIGFSQSGTTYSKNSIVGAENPPVIYYSELEPESATLDVNPVGDKVGDFTPLGINAKNNNDAIHANIDLLAVLNTTPILSQINATGHEYSYATITIWLSQKQADGTYGSYLDGSVYLTSVSVGDGDPIEFDDDDDHMYYTATVQKTDDGFEDNGDSIWFPEIHLTVLTGSAFESAGLTYGNFKITVEVELFDEDDVAYSTSKARSYVIYTNAKVIPEFITP